MIEEIIGREAEKKILKDALSSREAELIAILGRRRVGKTFLVRNYYQKYLVFECTGIHEAGLSEQLSNFSQSLQQSMKSTIPFAVPGNWLQAFSFLSDFLITKQLHAGL